MADAATSDWSSGSSGWGGGGMWGAPSPYGMQSPYGGFGGGMPYGGGYPMQSPYGAPMHALWRHSAYGMPQQQSMMAAPQTQQAAAAPQTMAATEAGVTPQAAGDGGFSWPDLFKTQTSGTQTTTFDPWQYQSPMLRMLYMGEITEDGKVPEYSKGLLGINDILRQQQALGPLGFDPSSEAGLARMEQLAGAGNPLVGGALDATRDITSGDLPGNRINTGGMFGNMYDDPGITGQQQYQDMARRDAIGNDQHYRDMIQRDAINNTAQYNQFANNNPLSAQQFNQIYGQQQGAGSLAGGSYGQVARGDLMNANPYREKAIQDAMDQTSDQVKATMSSRGRFGSDAYGDAMGRALGQVATTARMQGYDTDTANMMAAAQGRSQEALGRGGLGLQAAQGAYGAAAQNKANQLAAAQGISALQGTNAAQRLAQSAGPVGHYGPELPGSAKRPLGHEPGAADGCPAAAGGSAGTDRRARAKPAEPSAGGRHGPRHAGTAL